MRRRSIRRWGSRSRALFAVAAAVAGSWGSVALFQAPASASGALVGTFTITAGACNGGTVTGSYFRMILQGGNASGPYLSNSDSSCSDQSYTPMSPGTDGGLETGVYQPQPSPAFDSKGNALASRIISPSNFYGVRYAASTQPTDPQTGLSVPPPEISVSGSALSGAVQAVSVSWNNQYFNQGSPKPDGSSPGDTTPVTGTYDAATGAYTLQWTSQVVGGPFNGFSGLWHLTGRFVAASGAAGSAGAAAAPTGRGSSTALPTSATSGSASTVPSSGAGAAAGAQASGPTATQAAGSSGTTGGSLLATRTTRRSGLSPPTWTVALVIAAGAVALGAFALLRSRRPLRIASAAVVAAALATLGTFALWPASVTTTVTHHRAAPSGGSGAAPTPQTSLSAPVDVAAPAAPVTLASSAPVPIAVSGASGSAPPATQSAPPGGGGAPPASATVQCPLGLPAAANSGGLQSLVAFAPAFGPWSSEGFALAPAYAPLLQLFGPVIAELVAQSPQAAPVLDPVLSTLQSLDTQGYTALSPLYGPYREQMLSAETQLASALAPYSEQLANSAAGSCLVDLESMLVSQTQP